MFDSLNQVREIVHQWMIQYNEQRPHEALNNLTPMEFLQQFNAKSRQNEWI